MQRFFSTLLLAVAILFCASFFQTAQARDYCLVHSDDHPLTLQDALQKTSNGGCDPSYSFGDDNFADQLVFFATTEAISAAEKNAIKTIKLTSAIVLSPNSTVMVGNQTPDMLTDTDAEAPYDANNGYITTNGGTDLAEHGSVVINAKAFSGSPFTCAAGASDTYLRNMTINTQAGTHWDDIFSATNSCLKNGGVVVVFDGTTTEYGPAVEQPEVDGNAIDDDGDGFSEAQGDCDDNNPDANPNAAEILDDAGNVDENCDGHVGKTPSYDFDLSKIDIKDFSFDNGFTIPSTFSFTGLCKDEDGDDQFRKVFLTGQYEGVTLVDCADRSLGDCDDLDETRHKGATEICGDGIDQDCSGEDLSCTEICDDLVDNDGNGLADCSDSACADDVACLVPTETNCADLLDDDGDTLVDCDDSDCALEATCISVDIAETVCDDGIDDDSDTFVDCDDSDCYGVGSCPNPNINTGEETGGGCGCYLGETGPSARPFAAIVLLGLGALILFRIRFLSVS